MAQRAGADYHEASGLKVFTTAELNFGGLWYIDGDAELPNAGASSPEGRGITIVTTGTITVNGSFQRLEAFADDLLFFANKTDTSSSPVLKTSGSGISASPADVNTYDGVIYAPNGLASLGGQHAIYTTIVIADRLELSGSNLVFRFGAGLCIPDLTIDKIVTDVDGAGPDGQVDAAGDVISYQITVQNTGEAGSLLSGVTVTDPLMSGPNGTGPTFIEGDDGDSKIDAGETWIYTGAYTVQAGDIPGGVDSSGNDDPFPDQQINNTVTVDTDQTPAVTDTAEVDILDEPKIQVVKSQTLTTDANSNGLPDEGDVVTYSYDVTNTGNVTLSSVTLVDDVEGTLTLSDVATDGIGVLAVGDSETASAAHTVTQAEFDAGTLVNIATAAGEGPQGRPVQDTDTETVMFMENPAIQVVKTQELTTDANLNGLPDVGDVVTYSYTVTNTGDVTLSNVSLVDDVEGTLTLSDVALDGVDVLAVGDSETASSDHTVTQAEFDAGPLTNIATADGESPLGTNVSDTDTQTVNFTQTPAIQVVKSQALTSDANENGLPDVGDVVTYSYTVTNTGDVTLSNVVLDDTVEGILTLSDVAGDTVAVLAVGDSETASAAHTVTQAEFNAASLTNIATATGDGPTGTPVEDDDTVTVPQNPAIQVVKSQALTSDANLNGLPDVGDVVTYSYTVTNTGDVTLSNVVLEDDVEGVLTLSDAAGDTVAVLAVGDSETASSDHTVTQAEFDAGTLVNIATATGEGPTGTPVEDDDTVTVPFVQNPAIQVVKSQALTSDANLNGLPDVGDVVTYSYTVTNTGDVTLSNVVLDDTVEGILTLSDVAGDTVAVLAVGDSETASAAHTVTQAEFNAASLTNIATATGEGPTGTPVEDDDTVTVPFVQNPAIQVVKSQALTSDANLNGLPDVGDVVTYSYTVTNTGDVTLSNVVLDDTVEGILTLSDVAGDTVAVLAVGDSETASAAHTVTQAEFNAASLTNIATATGEGPTGTPVEDDDTVTVPFVQNPAIQVVKSQALTSDANLNGLPDVGDVVTYSYTVTNTGDVTLSNVVLDDTVEGILTLSDVAGDTVAVLAVGDSETASAAHTVTQAEFNAASLTNIATATGDGPTGTPVEDDDTVTVPFVQNPAIQVVKSQALTSDANLNGLPDVGDVVTYSYTVTNTGDVTLSNVVLDDTVAVLAVGDSETASAAHTVTQAEFNAASLTNIATATGDGPTGTPVEDDDTVTVPFVQNPAIQVVKSQALTSDANLNGLPDVGSL